MSSLPSGRRSQTSKADTADSKPCYPGLGLPLRYKWEEPFFPIGAHGGCWDANSAPINVREVAMMNVMEVLTDKTDWHVKVNDEIVVSKWRSEALAIPNTHWWDKVTSAKRQHWGADGFVQLQPDHHFSVKVPENIMSPESFDYCIAELRSKARYFEKTSIVPTLDACAAVAKSDILVSDELHESLLAAFRTLKTDQASSPDWHPNSDNKVQDLIHPSMYPLVYRRSRVFEEEVVGVEDAIINWSGKGTVIPGENTWVLGREDRFRYNVSGEVPPNFWSVKYQWLPANIAFQDDGTVRFTSYINNLHPTKYPQIYRTIEKLVETSLPMWDQCLSAATRQKGREGPGRKKERMPVPSNADDDNALNWIPSDPKDCPSDIVIDKKTLERQGGWWDGYENDERFKKDEDSLAEKLAECRWAVLRKPKLPEPTFEDVDYEPASGERLFERFRESGLQVIVKIASIELTPEKPYFHPGSWHVEGQLNERIAATALYYVDSKNITPTKLSFRMQTSSYLQDGDGGGFDVGQDQYHWLESAYGTNFGCGNSPCLQNYGSVETKEKRLLAFPNVFQHRVSGFELADPSKPGHRRFIALWLVDPHKRIISTANVPPQQMNWWAESLASSSTAAELVPEIVDVLNKNGAELPASTGAGTLPEELMAMVREYLSKEELPMGLEEANQHRLDLMKERSAQVESSEELWQEHSYNFCEH